MTDLQQYLNRQGAGRHRRRTRWHRVRQAVRGFLGGRGDH